jgi:hypothetical protein
MRAMKATADATYGPIGREAPWETFHATVDGLLERVQTPNNASGGPRG